MLKIKKNLKGFEIDAATITEKLKTSSGDYSYFAGIDITIDSKADFNLKEGVYENPSLDLSQDTGLHLMVVYSRKPILDDPKRLINSEDTLVEIRKMTQQVRDINNDIDKSLFVNPDQAKKMISPSYREENGIPADVAFSANIQYKFSFEKDLSSLYEEGKLSNINIAVIPFLLNLDGSSSVSDLEVVITKKESAFFYEKKQINLLDGGKISDSALNMQKVRDLRTEYYDKIFDFDLFSSNITTKHAVVSDLFSSYGKKNQIKGMFILDKLSLLRNESLFGAFLNNKGVNSVVINEITSDASIDSLSLRRNKVKNIRDFENRTIPISKNAVINQIVSTKESDGNFSIGKTIRPGSDDIMAEIAELKLDKENGRNKYVVFNDYDTSQDGKYVYSVQLRMRDGIRLFLQKSYDILNRNKKFLDRYHGQKYVTNSPTYSEASILKVIDNVATQMEILNDFAYNNSSSLRAELYNLTLSEQTLLNLIRFIERVLSGMAKKLNIREDTLIRSAATNSKLLQDRSTIIYNKQFSDYVEFGGIENLSYDYIGIPKNSNIGISLISESDLRERFNFEFNKIIKRPPDVVDFDDLSKKIFQDTFGRSAIGPLEESYFDMENNYFTFLSPIQIGKVELTKQNAFNNTIFNDFHLSQVTDDFLGAAAALSYSILGFSISINKKFIEKNNPKNSASQKQTYVNMDEVLPPEDKANTTATPNPSPLIPKFDGPTDTREKYSSFVNAILKDEEKWDISKKTFNQVSLGRSFKDSLPNQIRALFANSDACSNKWLSTDGDYFFNPDTYYMMKENYMNLAQIQVIKFREGLENPVYQNLNSSHLEGESPIICRMVLPVDEDFKIGSRFANRNYSNRHFVIIPSKNAPLASVGIVATDTIEPIDTSTRESFKAKEVPDYVINGPDNIIKP